MTNPQPARLRRRPPAALGLLLPGIAALIFAYVLPMAWVARMSVNRFVDGGGIEQTFTGESFAEIVTDSYYLQVAGTTVWLGVVVAALTVVVAYPLAMFLVRTESRFKGLLTILAIAPMLVSSVARTYGWVIVLGNQGLVNSFLRMLGISDRPLQLSNNFTGVVIALVQIFLPYAVLAMTSGFGRLDRNVEQAAASLGASRRQVFTRVTLPLTLPGVLTGALLVFVLAISAYVTPRLMGGGRVVVLATEIYDQATNRLNWPLAASLSVVLIVIFGVAMAGYQALQRRAERKASGQ
ncbi:ABC transporter permease [Nonomuraea insulae]|uniref:ABC transporter permease n=1 Tax=Nonomuraea insulae TaxID=1616787 RepID=A0ABW1D6A9_9ACTN